MPGYSSVLLLLENSTSHIDAHIYGRAVEAVRFCIYRKGGYEALFLLSLDSSLYPQPFIAI